MQKKWWYTQIGLIILAVIVLIYWRSLHYTFIYDDWVFLHSIIFKGPLNFLKDQFLPSGKILYRPLGAVYFVAMYELFGLNPLGFHIAALVLHLCSSLLVVRIVYHLNRNYFMAMILGITYAASVTVHMEPLLWLSGFYDVGGIFLLLLSIFFFIRGSVLPSVVAFCLAIITKEATVILPGILFGYMLFMEQYVAGTRSSTRAFILRLLPYFIVLAFYAVIKSFGASPFLVAEENPFKLTFVGSHVVNNFFLYLRWGLDTISPLKDLDISQQWMMFGMAIVFLFSIFYFITNFFYQKRDIFRSSVLPTLFWVLWFVIGLAPVLFLSHHISRYFFSYSLLPFLVLSYNGVLLILSIFRLKENGSKILLIILTIFNVYSAAYYYWNKENESAVAPAIEGSLNLVQKGRAVNAMKGYMLKTHPVLPPHPVLVGDCLNLKAIGYTYGLQVWYNDTTLRYYDLSDIQRDSAGMYVISSDGIHSGGNMISSGIPTKRSYLDTNRTFLFVYYQNEVTSPNLFTLDKIGK
jgi:hypothetical protein